MPPVTGSAAGPLVDAVYTRLTTDGPLTVLIAGRVFTSLPKTGSRVPFPYVVIGRVELGSKSAEARRLAGAMGKEGVVARLTLDTWSQQNGPSEAFAIQARIRVLFQRQPLVVAGFDVVAGSVTCEDELMFPDVDPEMPDRSLFHGVQQWTAILEDQGTP
jgi:hypothetical protein